MSLVNLFAARAATALIIKNNKVLILERSHTAKTYANYWQLPEGKIRLFENPTDTLVRELKEEIGYKLSSYEYLDTHFVFVFPKLLPIPVCRYVYRVPPPEKVDLSYEHSDFKWVSVSKLTAFKLVPGTEAIIKKYAED